MRSKARFLIIPMCLAPFAAFNRVDGSISAPVTPAHEDSVAVAKVVNDFHNALSRGDSPTALRLLSSEVVILESGAVETRSEYRSHHLPEDIEFAKLVATKRGPLKVRVNGGVAWTSATSETKGQFKKKPVDSTGAESMVLTKDVTGWRIQSIHWSSRRRTTSS